MPQQMSAVPETAPNHFARGSIFSNATTIVSTAIQMMFITPATKSSAIKAQQQPAQNAPCSTPMPNAP